MSKRRTILVIDDEESICFAFRRYFSARGFEVAVSSSGRNGLSRFRELRPDVVFVDVCLPEMDGLDVLKQVIHEDPNARVVVITAFGSFDVVSEAVESGAFDYLVKPLDLEHVDEIVSRALLSRQMARRPPDEALPGVGPGRGADVLVGRARATQEMYKRIGLVAKTDATVLILGETGTGKELVAQTVHRRSHRQNGPFIAVNCGALPDNLVESELFGHARGAFTGATGDKAGRLELADSGTLFLDEVGELPPSAQVKLLRFLDTRTVERLGTVAAFELDVRIVAATNRDLADAIAAGAFREDLYYRLSVLQVTVPPLRERREDIPLLSQHFLQLLSGEGPPPPLSREAEDALERHAWPGNVRELRNAVQHAVIVSGGGPILASHLPDDVRVGSPGRAAAERVDRLLQRYLEATDDGSTGIYQRALSDMERQVLLRILHQLPGNLSAVAERLGIHRNTLRMKLRELGLDRGTAQ